jgi:hypothetical protein
VSIIGQDCPGSHPVSCGFSSDLTSKIAVRTTLFRVTVVNDATEMEEINLEVV